MNGKTGIRARMLNAWEEFKGAMKFLLIVMVGIAVWFFFSEVVPSEVGKILTEIALGVWAWFCLLGFVKDFEEIHEKLDEVLDELQEIRHQLEDRDSQRESR